MFGRDARREERMIPHDHPLQAIRKCVDEVRRAMYSTVSWGWS